LSEVGVGWDGGDEIAFPRGDDSGSGPAATSAGLDRLAVYCLAQAGHEHAPSEIHRLDARASGFPGFPDGARGGSRLASSDDSVTTTLRYMDLSWGR